VIFHAFHGKTRGNAGPVEKGLFFRHKKTTGTDFLKPLHRSAFAVFPHIFFLRRLLLNNLFYLSFLIVKTTSEQTEVSP